MLNKIIYVEAVEVIPLKSMPKRIRENGGYRVMLLSGAIRLVEKNEFLSNYESISEADKFKANLTPDPYERMSDRNE